MAPRARRKSLLILIFSLFTLIISMTIRMGNNIVTSSSRTGLSPHWIMIGLGQEGVRIPFYETVEISEFHYNCENFSPPFVVNGRVALYKGLNSDVLSVQNEIEALVWESDEETFTCTNSLPQQLYFSNEYVNLTSEYYYYVGIWTSDYLYFSYNDHVKPNINHRLTYNAIYSSIGDFEGSGSSFSPQLFSPIHAYFVVTNDEVISCNGFMYPSLQVCSNHGNCVEEDDCECFSGYSFETCSQFFCNGVSHDVSTVCSSHGTCLSPNYCECESSYSGDNCDIGQGNICNLSPPCLGHGICNAQMECQCNFNYGGNNCQYIGENQLSSCLSSAEDVLICSGNGECELDVEDSSIDYCNCIEGWTGSLCEIDVEELTSIIIVVCVVGGFVSTLPASLVLIGIMYGVSYIIGRQNFKKSDDLNDNNEDDTGKKDFEMILQKEKEKKKDNQSENSKNIENEKRN